MNQLNFDAEHAARAQLMSAIEGGNSTWSREVGAHGAIEVVAKLREGGYLQSSPAATRRILDADAATIFASIERLDARLVIPGDSEWPTQLDDLAAPPFALCIRGAGDLRTMALHSIAIVGARAASNYGMRIAGDIAAQLGERGWSIVSGAAYGIDAAAHRGAIASGAQTAAVLASGVDQMYPSGHEKLFTSILENGVLVSEVLPGTPPTRGRFLIRNRVIAALTRGTLIVEAALRSGSLRTAAEAALLNRPVLAFPGPISSPTSAGCHRLIIEHRAELVSDVEDVLVHIGPLQIESPAPEYPSKVRDSLSTDEKVILEMFPARSPITIEKLSYISDLPTNRILALLGLLATLGFVEREGAGWILTKKGKTA